jgi:hypothetical protein
VSARYRYLHHEDLGEEVYEVLEGSFPFAATGKVVKRRVGKALLTVECRPYWWWPWHVRRETYLSHRGGLSWTEVETGREPACSPEHFTSMVMAAKAKDELLERQLNDRPEPPSPLKLVRGGK